MDAAALSGRLAAKAIGLSMHEDRSAIEAYSRLMKNLVAQTRNNQQNGTQPSETNAALQAHLDRSMLKMGMHLALQSRLNRFRSAEHQVMLP